MDSSTVTTISLITAVIGLIASIYYAESNRKNSIKKETEERTKDLSSIHQSISNLATKDYIDEKIEKEMFALKYDLNDKIESLKSDMKLQLNELKEDVKSQKEVANDMRADVIRTKESDKHAHELITNLGKRIDDIVAIVIKDK